MKWSFLARNIPISARYVGRNPLTAPVDFFASSAEILEDAARPCLDAVCRWCVACGPTNRDQVVLSLDVTTGEVRQLTKHEGDAQYHSPHWSGDGKSVFCASTLL